MNPHLIEFFSSAVPNWICDLTVSFLVLFPFVKKATGFSFRATVFATAKSQIPTFIVATILYELGVDVLGHEKLTRPMIFAIEYLLFPSLVTPMQAYLLKAKWKAHPFFFA